MSNGQRFIGSAACQAQRDLPLCAQEPASLGTLQFEWELELEATDAPDASAADAGSQQGSIQEAQRSKSAGSVVQGEQSAQERTFEALQREMSRGLVSVAMPLPLVRSPTQPALQAHRAT